ncbi:DUF305 domain-containing protein [Paractinoplanes rhizophilus]|uniref:DUF305 domain-containing protein n=1 Tax=Paractinoplanes rhizophilus TaxID=1416877 RepID=A0ABW2HPZ3_9ACTN
MRRTSILLAALLVLAGCGGAPSSPSPATTAAHTGGAGQRHAAADVEFVRALIPHHEAGIALARAAASRPAARTLAEAIIVTQQDEVVRMTAWLHEWGAPEPAAPGSAPGSAPASASAPASPPADPGHPADPLRALIAHQQEAIKLAQAEQANGTNPAALAFARQVIESRAAQIEQLREYLT